jgi:methyltransferase (TIGR00027 family)
MPTTTLLNHTGTAVALTSRWIAAARAHESARRDRLFADPFAAALADTAGLGAGGGESRVVTPFLDALILQAIRASGVPYLAIRTRFFDDLLVRALRTSGVRQVVLLAAGLDARAFRLPWPLGTSLYELDRPEVLAAKAVVLAGAQATCQRQTLGVDLTHPSWTQALSAAGYDAQAPSVWLIEGLLMYLDDAAVHALLKTVAELAVPGSWLGADLANWQVFRFPLLRPWLRMVAMHGAPWRFGTDTPEALFAAHGWEATVTQPGEARADYGRRPFVVAPRGLASCPRLFLVAAQRDHTTMEEEGTTR